MRNIENEMVEYLDKKLKDNALASHAISDKDARLLFRLAIEACVGISEATGRNDGKMVRLIQETIGDAQGEPWCMALMQTGIAYAEKKCGVKSEIFESELCSSVWNNSPKSLRVKSVPAPGALAVWGDIGANGKLKTSGHVEMVVSYKDDGTFSAIGGNTSGTTKPGSEVNRDGNACVYTKRSIKPTKKRKLLGFLKPF
jgi:hypothetical protein